MKEEILRLRGEGKTYTEIQIITGASKGTISYHCGAGQTEKALKRQRDRRNRAVKLVQELKQATPCADCGENYPYWIMDFDHLGNKEFNISDYVRHKLPGKINEEISKCDIVCSNCHRNRTYFRAQQGAGNSMDMSQVYL